MLRPSLRPQHAADLGQRHPLARRVEEEEEEEDITTRSQLSASSGSSAASPERHSTAPAPASP